MTHHARYYPPNGAGGIEESTAGVLRDAMSQSNLDRLEMIDDSATVSTAAEAYPFGPTFGIVSLTVHRWAAPAPWTEREFRYEWSVALCDVDPGRWVSGDVRVNVRELFDTRA